MTQQQIQEQRSTRAAKRCDITSPRGVGTAPTSARTERLTGWISQTAPLRRAEVFLTAHDIVKLFINVIVKKTDRTNSKGNRDILKCTPSLQALCVVLMDEVQLE